MPYDKPKVTIDLEEYDYLKNRIKELNKKIDAHDTVLDLEIYKKAIWAFLEADRGLTSDAERLMRSVGVEIVLTKDYNISVEDLWNCMYVRRLNEIPKYAQ